MMSARPSPFTSAQSRPVLESALAMKPFDPYATVDAGNTNAFGSVYVPPSGFCTMTSTAPLPLLGRGTGAENVSVVELTTTGLIVVCVAPGFTMSFAPAWKLSPVAVYGPGAAALFGVMPVSTGPGLIVIESCRVATCC